MTPQTWPHGGMTLLLYDPESPAWKMMVVFKHGSDECEITQPDGTLEVHKIHWGKS